MKKVKLVSAGEEFECYKILFKRNVRIAFIPLKSWINEYVSYKTWIFSFYKYFSFWQISILGFNIAVKTKLN